MRKLLFVVLLLLVGSSALFAQRISKIEIYFQRYHTEQDLKNIQEELAVMGVRISYNRAEFDEQGRLLALGISVDCNDGFTGEAYLKPIPEANQFGFIRDYRSGAAQPFVIGNLSELKAKE